MRTVYTWYDVRVTRVIVLVQYKLGSRRTHLLFGRFSHSFNGGPVCAMCSIVISVKRRLAWTPPSPQFFLWSEVRFQRCAETPRRRSKSAQRRAASSSPWSTFLSEVRSDLPYAQPTSETFDLNIRPRILNIHTTPRLLCVAVAPRFQAGIFKLARAGQRGGGRHSCAAACTGWLL